MEHPFYFVEGKPHRPHLCPVSHFCALAFADDAFSMRRSPSDLSRVGQGIEVQIKKEMANVPVLRRLTEAGEVSDRLVLTSDTVEAQLSALGKRAGYKEPLTPYAIRRGHGNKLDQGATSSERRQRMGHKDDDTFQHYISQIQR